jgi:hypothetical protein
MGLEPMLFLFLVGNQAPSPLRPHLLILTALHLPGVYTVITYCTEASIIISIWMST